MTITDDHTIISLSKKQIFGLCIVFSSYVDNWLKVVFVEKGLRHHTNLQWHCNRFLVTEYCRPVQTIQMPAYQLSKLAFPPTCIGKGWGVALETSDKSNVPDYHEGCIFNSFDVLCCLSLSIYLSSCTPLLHLRDLRARQRPLLHFTLMS